MRDHKSLVLAIMRPAVPAAFVCPISQEVMTDPVVDPEGNSYGALCGDTHILTTAR